MRGFTEKLERHKKEFYENTKKIEDLYNYMILEQPSKTPYAIFNWYSSNPDNPGTTEILVYVAIITKKLDGNNLIFNPCPGNYSIEIPCECVKGVFSIDNLNHNGIDHRVYDTNSNMNIILNRSLSFSDTYPQVDKKLTKVLKPYFDKKSIDSILTELENCWGQINLPGESVSLLDMFKHKKVSSTR